jgi:hypothetical protein
MITVNVINNEWYFTYNKATKIATKPTFVEINDSVIVGQKDTTETSQSEQECYDRIKVLGLTISESDELILK